MFGKPTISGFRVDYAVTAWQPLPEPYKAKGSNKEWYKAERKDK